MKRLSVLTGVGKKSEAALAAEKWVKQEETWGKYMNRRQGFISENWQVLPCPLSILGVLHPLTGNKFPRTCFD